jgi:ATP-dependent DNA helicase RecQ
LKPDFDPQHVSLAREEQRSAYERSRLEMMRGYAETTQCRRRYILNYFGEDLNQAHCDACDNDIVPQNEGRVVVTETETVDSPFAMGERVQHTSLGDGTVQRIAEDSITVLFDTAGYKTLALALVLGEGLLQAANAAKQVMTA